MIEIKPNIKAIIGLGNPGAKYYNNRHNIGFRVLDQLSKNLGCQWQSNDKMEFTQCTLDNKNIILVKPQTFMNSSGLVLPFLKKKNIEPDNLLVVHDELEIPFGEVRLKFSGSHKGHNGLKSIISIFGADFYKLRIGIGRPEKKEDVPDYVLSNFSQHEQSELPSIISKAVDQIENIVK